MNIRYYVRDYEVSIHYIMAHINYIEEVLMRSDNYFVTVTLGMIITTDGRYDMMNHYIRKLTRQEELKC